MLYNDDIMNVHYVKKTYTCI